MFVFILAGDSIENWIRQIFVSIDVGIFWLFEQVLANVFVVAGVTIFNEKIINEVLNRIYIIIGLYITFKLAFSIITYIVSPDKMSDQEQGFGKIITRVIIALSLLVLVPSIFDYARKAQFYILPVIPRIILGISFNADDPSNETNEISESTIKQIAQAMSLNTYLSVFNYNTNCNDAHNTIAGTPEATDPNQFLVGKMSHIYGAVNIMCGTTEDEYKFQYTTFVGLVLGCFLTYMMLGISIDVAIRAIKLGLLELLAPIPIMSYIDPKSSKDGAFSNWVKYSISTYVDLFARISIIYLVIFFFDQLFQGNVLGEYGALVYISIIVGIFFFMKQFPKFIKDILGLKGEGHMFRDVLTGRGTFGLATGTIGGAYKAKKEGGSAFLGAIGGLGGSTKKFLSNAVKDERGGTVRPGAKAGEEVAKVNTGFRGRMNRAAGGARANRLGYTQSRVDDLRSATEKAKLLADQAGKEYSAAVTSRRPASEVDAAQAKYDTAREGYENINKRYTQFKGARDSMVKEMPAGEQIEADKKVARGRLKTEYKENLGAARSERKEVAREAKEARIGLRESYESEVEPVLKRRTKTGTSVKKINDAIRDENVKLSRIQSDIADSQGLLDELEVDGDPADASKITELRAHISEKELEKSDIENEIKLKQEELPSAERKFKRANQDVNRIEGKYSASKRGINAAAAGNIGVAKQNISDLKDAYSNAKESIDSGTYLFSSSSTSSPAPAPSPASAPTTPEPSAETSRLDTVRPGDDDDVM